MDRSGNAQHPSEISGSGWKQITYRVKDEIGKDNLTVISAGVAFYGFLAIFPALAALVSIYGLITDPASLQEQLASFESILPAEAAQLVNEQLQRLLASHQTSLGWGLVVSLVIALWSAAKGMNTIFTAMNVAYDEPETRGFVRLTLLALTLTLGAVVFVILFLFIIIGMPLALRFLALGDSASWVLNILRWPLLAIAGATALGVLYRYGPDRKQPRWQWVSWGAVISTVLWLIGSGLFSLYVANFGSYNSTYGSLGVVVVLMTWLLLSAYCVLLGAEINSEIEQQAGEFPRRESRAAAQTGAARAPGMEGNRFKRPPVSSAPRRE